VVPLDLDVFVQDNKIEDVENQNQVEDHLTQVQHLHHDEVYFDVDFLGFHKLLKHNHIQIVE